MKYILIETSTERGVIALIENQEIVYSKYLPFGMTQSQLILPYLKELCCEFNLWKSIPDGIAIGVGPGSYTGIRVGVAAGQALAYAWNIPIFEICSLHGFIPSIADVAFAALIDARIGGVYLVKGISDENHQVTYLTEPALYSLEEAREVLKETSYLITPNAKSLKIKLEEKNLEKKWYWEETNPSLFSLDSIVFKAWNQNKKTIPPAHLKLLYLRETEAERGLKNLSP